MGYLEAVNELVNATPIEEVIGKYISIQKKGANYVAICPFHQDTNPSMIISPTKKIFKCFVCGTGGNVVTFVQKYENISFKEAVKKVADMVGYKNEMFNVTEKKNNITLTPAHLALKTISDYYSLSLKTLSGKEALDYCINRGLNEEVIAHFSIGYAPKDNQKTIEVMRKQQGITIDSLTKAGILQTNAKEFKDRYYDRIMFPLKDGFGNVVGFSGRIYNPSNEPKYINSPESALFEKSKLLYNLHNAKLTARKDGYLYVFEGFMDVIASYKASINSAVALMGTALTQYHIKIFQKMNVEIRLCLDGDNPGQQATYKNIKLLQAANIKFRIVDSTNNDLDPDEIYKKFGKEALHNFLNKLISPVEFSINYLKNVLNLDNQKLISELSWYFENSKDEMQTQLFAKEVSEILGVDVSIVRKYFKVKKKNTTYGMPNLTKNDDVMYMINYLTDKVMPSKVNIKSLITKELCLIYHLLYDKNNLSRDKIFVENECYTNFRGDDMLNKIFYNVSDAHMNGIDLRPELIFMNVKDIYKNTDIDENEKANKIKELEILETCLNNTRLPELNEQSYRELINSLKEEKQKLLKGDNFDDLFQTELKKKIIKLN